MLFRENKKYILMCTALISFVTFTVNLLSWNLIKSQQFKMVIPRLTANTSHNLSLFKPLSYECIFPEVDPFDPQILEMAGLGKLTLSCKDFHLAELTYIDGLKIRVNTSAFDQTSSPISCRYRNVTRKIYEDNSIELSKWSKKFSKFIHITKEHEFLFVKCNGILKKNKIMSKAFYSLVPKRAHLDGLYKAALNKRNTEFKPQETLNFIAVALDGLPRHQMIRAMPKTYKYLTEELNSFDFTKHSQSGGRTFPNMLSLLSAYSEEEIVKWWNNTLPEDAFELIWKDFERAGYRTLFTEDHPEGGGFYWVNKTFLNPQTSYWNRPLELLMAKEPRFVWKKMQCLGRQPITKYHLNYLTKFLDTFPKDPVSCMTVISEITHDDITRVSSIDEHILHFYQTLGEKGHLNNSVVMFFSDHGARWGPIRATRNGIVEHKNPFMVLTFPPWFLGKYPEISSNLQINTRRLTTHSDARQMLLDMLYFKVPGPTPPFRGKRGRSLFQQMPVGRTCQDASIPEEMCLCEKELDTSLDVHSPQAQRFAKSIVSELNKKSDPSLCERYKVDEILDVSPKTAQSSKIKHATKRLSLFLVKLLVKPGGAIFEGTITVNHTNQAITVGKNIDRLNMYKGEVLCLPLGSPKMEFCYCKANTH